MNNNVIPYTYNGEAIPPDEVVPHKFMAMWNAAAQIDDDMHTVNGIDLDALRRTMVQSHDGTYKSGLISLRELGECLVRMGQQLITVSDNKLFLCRLMARKRSRA